MIQTGVNTDLHHLTDERISGRVRGTYSEDVQPVITQFAPFVRIRHEGERARAHLMGGHSRRKDFIYHESAGREWPARLQRTWTAGMAAWDLDAITLEVRTDASRASFSNRPSFIDLPLPLTMDEASAEGALTRKWHSISWKVAAGARAWQIEQATQRHSRLIPTASAEISSARGTWTSHTSFHLARLDDTAWQSNAFSWQGHASLTHSGAQGMITMDVAAIRGHFPEPGYVFEWSLAGVEFGDWLPALDAPEAMTTPTTFEAGLTGRRSLADGWQGWAQAHVRIFDGQLLPDRIIDQRFGIGPLLPVWNWSTGHGGWLFSRAIGAERLDTDRISWRAFLQFYHVSSQGDDVFFRHQTGFPRHRLQIMASDQRPGGVRWMTRLGYVSAWTWPEYREPARREKAADIIAEATIGKTLFSGYADALISLLNIPDRALGNHPAGVEEQLAIRLTLSIAPVSRAASR